MPLVKRALLGVMAALYLTAGVSHFAVPGFYAHMVPAWLPAPYTLVQLSGIVEIALGALVLVPATRRAAAWGIILLLIVVFPANVNMAVNRLGFHDAPAWLPEPTPLGLWLRLPVQGLLVAWAWWYTRDD